MTTKITQARHRAASGDCQTRKSSNALYCEQQLHEPNSCRTLYSPHVLLKCPQSWLPDVQDVQAGLNECMLAAGNACLGAVQPCTFGLLYIWGVCQLTQQHRIVAPKHGQHLSQTASYCSRYLSMSSVCYAGLLARPDEDMVPVSKSDSPGRSIGAEHMQHPCHCRQVLPQ